jgi:hypothetical protein
MKDIEESDDNPLEGLSLKATDRLVIMIWTGMGFTFMGG